MRAKIIVNPIAGRGKAERAIPTIRRIFTSNKNKFDIFITEKPGDATNQARYAAQQGYDAVISVGGDGTANEVVNGIAEQDITLGVIPCGSGNDLAMSMNIPSGIDEACEIILKGNIRKRDLGKATGRYFANTIGIGFDAAVAKTANKSLRNFPIRGIPLYVLAMLMTLQKYKSFTAHVTVDDQMLISSHPLLIAVGIGKSYGGGLPIVPYAIPDDGLYDICIVEAISTYQIIATLPKALRGKHLNDAKTIFTRGKSIYIQLSAITPFHMDGEVFESDCMEVSIIPGGLRVFHP
ncbi:MAG: diacylglycerol kinase family lipid kinase [Firmicutes bacterium]|nr:diacylglycerol kinase family lipid kinase [Bacillota bacterium]